MKERAGPTGERHQNRAGGLAQVALNPCDNLGRVQAIDNGNLFEPVQQGGKTRGHLALDSLEVVNDRREGEKAEGRERAGHEQQEEKDGCRALERMPPADAQPGRGAHHRREHNGKERGDVKQGQDTAQQPRDVDREGKSEDEDNMAANVLCGVRCGLIHARRSLRDSGVSGVSGVGRL